MSVEIAHQQRKKLKKTITQENLIPTCSMWEVYLNKTDLNFEELESIDSLTSKFGRTSDIYLQKVLRTVWLLLREDTVPLIDLLNRAEKLRMILSADQLLQMRDIRNQITHEYLPEAAPELALEVNRKTEQLAQNIEQTERFLRQRDWL